MSCTYGLIADIGGTNARFAIADQNGYYEERVLKSADYSNPVEMARTYMELIGRHDIKRGSFAIAGPVDGDIFFAVNLPWSFSIKELGADLGLDELKLYNDFTAVALSLPFLKNSDIRQHGGDRKDRSGLAKAVIGPGTGLGAAGSVMSNGKYHVVPGEGGHATVPVRTRREFEVMNILQQKYSHASAERVCSGQGLKNIYDCLRQIDGRLDLPDLKDSEISTSAINGSCELCRESLDMMMGILGRVASNLVLTLGAWGGIYIAGGIVGRLEEYFYSSPFRREFEDKGRFSDTLRSVPAYVIQHPQPALLGLQSNLMC